MIPYKSKVIHVEGNILNFSPLIQNRNAYHWKEDYFGDGSSMVFLDDKHLDNNIISGNTYPSGNRILESRDLVLSSVQIGILCLVFNSGHRAQITCLL